MKKLLLVALFAFLFIIPSVYGTTVAYVSQYNCNDCTCYNGKSQTDYLYCTALENLTYTVKTVWEDSVISNATIWVTKYSESDMVFLGDVSLKAINEKTTSDKTISDNFCKYIYGAYEGLGIPIFSTSLNNHITVEVKGCLFKKGIVHFTGTDNLGVGGNIQVIPPGSIITSGLNLDETLPIYTTTAPPIYVHNVADGGHVGIICSPPGAEQGHLYPTINTPGSHAFWGLTDPSKYNETAWLLFNRTVKLVLSPVIIPGEAISANLTTNTNNYKPGQTIYITFTPNITITNAKLYFLSPGASGPTPYDMEESQGNWTYNITLGTKVANGTYEITVIPAGFTDEFKKTVDVIPYSLSISTDKYSYIQGDEVKIYINTIDAYSTSLTMTGDIDIENPAAQETALFNGNIPRIFNTTYDIPDTAVGGKYHVQITLTDSDGRSIYKELEFVVKSSGNLNATPSQWTASTKTGYISQLFIIGNTGNTTLSGITVTKVGNCTFSLSRTTLPDILPNKTTNFTANTSISREGICNSEITLSSDEVQFIIDMEITYSPEAIVDALVISPSSISVVTIPGKRITKTFSLENTASINADITGYKISDDLDNIVTVEDIPSTINDDDSEEMEIEINTAGLSPDYYTGTLTVNSDVGNDTTTISINVIEDLSAAADDLLDELTALKPSIDALEKKEGYAGLVATYDNIESDIEEVKTEYAAGNYESSLTLFEGAGASLTSLKGDITSVASQKKDYGGVIWGVTAVVIISILGVLGWRYRYRIIDFINRIFRRRKKYQEPQPEYYPPEEPQSGDYRTGYY